MGFLDNTGLADILTRIKNAFVAKADTQTVTGIDLVAAQAISVDSTPTANSNNLVTSGGVKSYVDGAIPSVSGLESASNKVTSLSSSSTDTEYPSAKCVYDLVGDIETLLSAL